MGKTSTPSGDLGGEPEWQPFIEEAERLAAALVEHQERELPEARAQLEEALGLAATLPAIRADAAACRITAEQAEAKIRTVTASVAAAQQRMEDAERLSAELLRRTAEAGRAAGDAMLAETRATCR